MSRALVKVDVVVGEGHHASVIITSVWQWEVQRTVQLKDIEDSDYRL